MSRRTTKIKMWLAQDVPSDNAAHYDDEEVFPGNALIHGQIAIPSRVNEELMRLSSPMRTR